MLAPFFVNLLIWSGLLLLAGWLVDVANAWFDSARQEQSSAGSGRLSRSGSAMSSSRLPVCVACDLSSSGVLTSRTATRARNG